MRASRDGAPPTRVVATRCARELAVFRDNSAREPLDDAFHFLFRVHGLVNAVVGDEPHSAPEAMETAITQLGYQGHPLKKSDKHAAEWQRQRQRQEADVVPAESGMEGPGERLPRHPPSARSADQHRGSRGKPDVAPLRRVIGIRPWTIS
ncbi:hypothetical protein ACSNOK_28575 [Streptomyces sp. URMC 126]|uniref:hypothetical protein n=1 Tax=Streptomyces sp. URMC 126 TaxID=3423401 RepID=UPI003F1DE87C